MWYIVFFNGWKTIFSFLKKLAKASLKYFNYYFTTFGLIKAFFVITQINVL